MKPQRQYGGQQPISHTQQPTLVGSSVFALKYQGGVLVLADTLGTYGNMSRHMCVNRIAKVADHTCIAAMGDIADFQDIQSKLDQLLIDYICENDTKALTPRVIYSYLGRLMYGKRNKFDPYWNTLVIAGVEKGNVPFLGYVDSVGTRFEENMVATGMGMYFGMTLFRNEWVPNMTFDAARQLLERAALVTLYRDKSAVNRFQIANITPAGVEISEPFAIETNWDMASATRHFADLK